MSENLILDGSGIYGNIIHYTLIFLFMGLSGIAFLYFWAQGRLDMDDAAAIQMLKEDDTHGRN